MVHQRRGKRESRIWSGVRVFLNYASLADVKELFRIVGIEKAAEEFHRQVGKSERASKNYNIVSKNYYINYFKRHAS